MSMRAVIRVKAHARPVLARFCEGKQLENLDS